MTRSCGDTRRWFALCAVFLVAASATSASVALGTDHPGYAVDIDGAVAVPSVTYSADGETVEVTAIARATAADTLSFAVDAPAGEYYTVRIVDSEQNAVETTGSWGDDTFRVPLHSYDVGTYVVAVTNASGDTREVYAAAPFVVSGYDVTQETDASVDADGTLHVTATVEVHGDPPAFDTVTVVVGNESHRTEMTAERVNESTYAAEIDASTLAPGEYTVVTGVRGDRAFDGTVRELLGLSADATVTVKDSTSTTAGTATAGTPTTTDGASEAGDAGGATVTATPRTGSTATVTPVDTATDSTTSTATTTTAADTSDGANATATTATAGTVAGADGTTEGTPETDAGGVTATPETPAGGTTAATGALFGPLGYVLLLTVSLFTLLARRRGD